MRHRLAHRVGRSSQATPAAVDKPQGASHTEFLTLPRSVAPFQGLRQSRCADLPKVIFALEIVWPSALITTSSATGLRRFAKNHLIIVSQQFGSGRAEKQG